MRNSARFVMVFLALVVPESVMSYSDPGYPYTVSGCTAVCYSESRGFCKNNCTSYDAYMLNDVYGVPFNNSYLQPSGYAWGNGGSWNDAAGRAVGDDIVVDTHPLPQDVAYWEYDWTGNVNNHTDDWGHVAWVEKVYFDTNGNATGIDITEYNYNSACGWGWRHIDVGSSDYPDGFIHILAYNEAVNGLHYLDCYEQYDLCNTQTQQEWNWIVNRVWSNYRCRNNCNSIYSTAYVDSLTSYVGGMGGGGNGNTSPLDLEQTLTANKTDGTILHSSTDTLTAGMTLNIRAQLKAKNADCADHMEAGKDTVETDYYVQINGGSWDKIGREYTQAVNLPQDETHSETRSYAIPSGISTIRFRTIIDAEDEAIESDEGETDNTKTTGTYTVASESAPLSSDKLNAILSIITRYLLE